MPKPKDWTQIDGKIQLLIAQKKRGVEIAQILKDAGHTSDEVKDALYKARFVVAWEGEGDFRILHVSDYPMEAGLAALIAASEPRALPSFLWPQKIIWVDA